MKRTLLQFYAQARVLLLVNLTGKSMIFVCDICHSEYDVEEEGVSGHIGIIPASFCGVCVSGITDFVQRHCCNREVGCALDEEDWYDGPGDDDEEEPDFGYLSPNCMSNMTH